MMIKIREADSGNEIYLNIDNITEIDELKSVSGVPFSRVYLANGHRTFIDVNSPAFDLVRTINEATSKAAEALQKIWSELYYIEKDFTRMNKK